MIDAISVVIKNIRQKVAGSLKNRMPMSAVPTAPMPVHTAYAVPIGSAWLAFTSNTMLMMSDTKKPAYHPYISFPLDSFALARHDANATSNNPATINMIQFTCFFKRKGGYLLSQNAI